MLCVEVDVAGILRGISDCDNLTCVCADAHQFVVLAGGKELMADAIDGQSIRSCAGRQLPSRRNLPGRNVDACDLAAGRERHEDSARPIANRRAWTPSKWN